MRIIVLAMVLSLFTASSFAQPVDTNVENNGYNRFPVLKCPDSDSALKDVRKKLEELKVTIKKGAKCEGAKDLEGNINTLSGLLGKDRADFQKLMEKGKTEGLTSQEKEKVEKYVQDVTTSSSTLIDVVSGNDACFQEDKKGNTLELITGVIGEASKVLSVVGGPQIGLPVQTATTVIVGFMKAMKAIRDNRRGYHFEVADQQIAYSNALCSFFDYKTEIDNLVKDSDTQERLTDLQYILEGQMARLREQCPECAQLELNIAAELKAAAEKIEDDDEAKEKAVDQVWPAEVEKSIKKQATEIDKLYTMKVGTHMYRSSKTLAWIPIRIGKIKKTNFQADLGVKRVMSEMDDLENFLVADQAPKFMGHIVMEAHQKMAKISDALETRGRAFDLMYIDARKTLPAGIDTSNKALYYGAMLDVLAMAKDDRSVNANVQIQIESFLEKFHADVRNVGFEMDVINKYCEFFRGARWYNNQMNEHCDGFRYKLVKDRVRMLSNLSLGLKGGKHDKSFRSAPMAPRSFPVPVAGASVQESLSAPEKPKYSKDWIDSLGHLVDDMSSRPGYVQRKK